MDQLDGGPAGGDVDEPCTEEEFKQYQEALALNEQLRAMMENGLQLEGLPAQGDDENYYKPAPARQRRRQPNQRGAIRLTKEKKMSHWNEAPAGSHLKQRRKNNYTHNEVHLPQRTVIAPATPTTPTTFHHSQQQNSRKP